MEVGEWDLVRGDPCFFCPTPRHTIQPDELIALIVCPYDCKHGQAARVISLDQGTRNRKNGTYSEKCLLLHLAFSSGDHGIWTAPPYDSSSIGTPHHATPYLFYRLPLNKEGNGNPAADVMDSQGRGLTHFLDQYKAIRNGTGNIDLEYLTLFGHPLPS